jgi:hypothetical protein
MTTATPQLGRVRITHHPSVRWRAMRILAALLFAFALSGCGVQEYLSPTLPYAQLAIPYNSTQIGRSTSLEVLTIARDPAYQFDPDQVTELLLTQSDTVISYSGRREDTYKTWLNMIAFDEFRMVARRKYFFCVAERATLAPGAPRQPLVPPRRGILFDAEFLIDPDVLTTPYATEESQRIAILQWLAGQFQQDMTALVGDPRNPVRGSRGIVASGMMVNQIFQGVLAELVQSPGQAVNLGAEQGIPFPHASLDNARIRLLTRNDLGAIRVRVHFPMIETR